MRIAYILPSLDTKAPIFLAKRLSDYFLQHGNEVKVFYFDNLIGTKFNCPTVQIKENEKIDFDSFDIIHSHMFRPDKYLAKFSKSIHNAKIVSTIHCNIAEDLEYSYGKLVSFFFMKKWLRYLTRFNATVQINDYLLDLYSPKLQHNKLIYNGISISDEKDDYSEIINHISEFKKHSLSVLCSYSGIIERKGLLQILQLLTSRKDLAYICIGEGKQKQELIDFAIKNKIADRVFFSPFKKNPYHVMTYADVFMIPSYSEGFSLALLEAGTIGSSVVCSNIPAFSKPFINDVSFFELNDIKSLSSAVDEALKNKTDNTIKLQEHIKKDFSEEKMFSEYEKLYKHLI